MIEVKNLNKSFEDKQVLFDVNAHFESGKTNLIIGQSGSGKTVIMKCLVGLLERTAGARSPTCGARWAWCSRAQHSSTR